MKTHVCAHLLCNYCEIPAHWLLETIKHFFTERTETYKICHTQIMGIINVLIFCPNYLDHSIIIIYDYKKFIFPVWFQDVESYLTYLTNFSILSWLIFFLWLNAPEKCFTYLFLDSKVHSSIVLHWTLNF
jgi:hypothetical protein